MVKKLEKEVNGIKHTYWEIGGSDLQELRIQGAMGDICDECGKKNWILYYIPELNHGVCSKCLDKTLEVISQNEPTETDLAITKARMDNFQKYVNFLSFFDNMDIEE